MAKQGNEGAWSNVRIDCSDGVQMVERGEGDWTRRGEGTPMTSRCGLLACYP